MRLTRTNSSMASAQLGGGEADVFHAVDLGGIDQAADVFAQTEHRGSAGRGVAADPLEYTNCRNSPRATRTWILASSQGIKRPLCQIFSVGVSMR